jgi:hypothetical protein
MSLNGRCFLVISSRLELQPKISVENFAENFARLEGPDDVDDKEISQNKRIRRYQFEDEFRIFLSIRKLSGNCQEKSENNGL